MKMLLSLLLLIAVPVVVAQTIVDAPVLEEPAIQDLAAESSQEVAESLELPTAAVPESVSHDFCCGKHDIQETAEVVSSACSGCAKCCCGSCCHVGGCGDENPCGTGCQGVCCNNVILEEHGNILPSDGAIIDDGGVVVLPDGSATAIDDGMYASGTSVRGFGGGSGISAFSGGWGIGFAAVGGGGGGGAGRRAAAFAAGVGVTRGFRDRRPLSASD